MLVAWVSCLSGVHNVPMLVFAIVDHLVNYISDYTQSPAHTVQ
jgi:hypothetical protein